MADYIMLEIEKIRKVFEAIMLKMGILKGGGSESAYEVVQGELWKGLKIDIDPLLTRDDLPDTLVREHGFGEEELERLAGLLFETLEPTGHEVTCDGGPGITHDRCTMNTADSRKIVAAITAIHSYLDRNSSSYSLNRHYISQELEKYRA